MKKTAKILLSLVLTLTLVFCFMSVTFAKSEADYTIVSPYADVIWQGDNAWGAYKGTLHSHSTYSDADESLEVMVKEYYEQGYDFLANADHGITGTEWNKEQTSLALYTYQKLSGKEVKCLTDEEFEGITTGTYPLYNGTIRNKKMVCVTGANELNNLTLTKSHVNGYYLKAGVGDGFGGSENGFEQAIAFIEKNGGLSHINHPGDWLESINDISQVSKEENVKFLSELVLKYPSCLGIEVFNEKNGVTPYDRILWDNMLMYTLPYGRTVLGFSNTDAHNKKTVDTSFCVFMMEDNTTENIKETMQSGAFFAVTRILRANDVIGPKEDIDARNKNLPYPMFTSINVDGHTISVNAKKADTIQWIANGKVIASTDIKNDAVSINLDEIDGAEDFKYVRAELFGKGGICLTQAFVIDDGTEKEQWVEESGIKAFFEDLIFMLKSSRFWTIIVELCRMV